MISVRHNKTNLSTETHGTECGLDKFERLHLREWRLHKGLTGQQLADLSGITRSEVSRLEHGNRRLTMNHAKLLSSAMGLLPEDLARMPEGALANIGSVHVPKGDRPEFRVMVAGGRFMTDEPVRFLPTASDEMRPTFMAGDYVAVDTSVKSLAGGGIYALKLDGIECLRRVQVIGKIAKLIFDNERYSAVEMAASEVDVVGKAICVLKPI